MNPAVLRAKMQGQQKHQEQIAELQQQLAELKTRAGSLTQYKPTKSVERKIGVE